MRKIITTLAVGGLSALMALTSVAPVQAMPIQAPTAVQQTENRAANVESVEWRHHRRGWDRRHAYRHDRRYDRRYYGHRRHHHSNGAAIIGGLAAGAIIGGAIANSNNHRYYYHNGRRYLRD
ncbi:BA14K family protein [Rhizobium sp. S152]|uniref:BA14K family protein n=1 Tax=Rhizobium sp. S152 TaxID=3055038 RepID=UPI0025A9895E|nr:BA14K family protein [Rhizobium sp. S152]MDM9626629.1 BA14K family protein [Rhizobium sp. S152]